MPTDINPDHDLRDDPEADAPTTRTISDVEQTDDGFYATLFIPGHVHREVADFVSAFHDDGYAGAETVVESFTLTADEPDEVTLTYCDGMVPGAVDTFVGELCETARGMFSDTLSPDLFDTWSIKQISVTMAGITIRARFYEDPDVDYMPDDHPAFEQPPTAPTQDADERDVITANDVDDTNELLLKELYSSDGGQ